MDVLYRLSYKGVFIGSRKIAIPVPLVNTAIRIAGKRTNLFFDALSPSGYLNCFLSCSVQCLIR